jgi:hypothetical protein
MGEEDKFLADAYTCKRLGLFVSIRYHEQGPALIPTEVWFWKVAIFS